MSVLKGLPTIRKASLTSKKIVKSIAEFASDKKAENIVVLDMRKVVNFCDYFVICSGNSTTQNKAIADAIEEGLRKLGVNLRLSQGFKNATWIVLDAGDVVVHVFEKETREFYQLEYLWQEAKTVDWTK